MGTRTSRFFVDHDLTVGRELSLSEKTSHHIKNVLRLRKDATVILFNGQGGEYSAQITSLEGRRVSVHLYACDEIDRESSLTTELGLGIIKRDAMDIAIRKSTELGVTRIVPLLADFSTVTRRQAEKRFPHWLEIIHSACEQCGRNRPPELRSVIAVSEWLGSVDTGLRLAAHFEADTSFGSLADTPDSVSVLTGPEGGLSDQELELARARQFKSISLGPRILRANTAPLVMLTLIQHKWGDL